MTGYAALVDYSATQPQMEWLEQAGAKLAVIAPGELTRASAPHFSAVCRALDPGNPGSPLRVQERYLLLGDVRLDRRRELRERLQSHFRQLQDSATDLQLLFYAWLRWGKQLEDLACGDFSLLIWDQQQQQLHCLRDQVGIKPLYFAHLGEQILVSNCINALRLHPALGSELDSRAVIDFLAFGHNTDLNRTTLRAIAQLPPAHLACLDRKGSSRQRYWNLPIDAETDYSHAKEYVEHFRQELQRAVADRCRGNSVAVAMSGGLDSTSLAAVARGFTRTSAYTIHGTGEEQELESARLAAAALGLKHEHLYADPAEIFVPGNHPDWPLPEPSRDCYRTPFMSLMQRMASSHTNGMTGLGGDSILSPSSDYLAKMFRSGQWGRMLADMYRFVRSTGARPPLHLRASLRKRYERAPLTPILPPWLNPDAVRHTNLQERFDGLQQAEMENLSPHPRRPEAYRDLQSTLWPSLIQRYSGQTTGLPLEFSHPFFDLRMIRLLLAFPPLPWFYRKWILREAMRGILPEAVRTRPKSTPAAPGHRDTLLQHKSRWQSQLAELKELESYIDLQRYDRIMKDVRQLQPSETSLAILPLCLSLWQQQL